MAKPRLTVLAIAFLVACSRDAPQSEPSVSDVTAEVPADVDWRLYGNDWGEQRFSELDQINRENVGELGLAWSFDLYTQRGIEATPLMVDGTLYVSGSWSMVYALDAVTGELKWFHDPEVDRASLARACCDAVNRGVAYDDGRIFVGTLDGRLVALDAGTGDVAWDVQTTDREQSYTITGAPRIADGKVIIGNGGADMGVRGFVSAYDARTGEIAWRFYTVPGNPAEGFENATMEGAADTWNGEWWEWGGGGTVWDSIVYDPQLDLVYVGVGNGAARNQNVRSPGGGDNLFLASIVALDADTGEYVWHYQTTPGDTWDYTATQHMILAELHIDGETRSVLMQAPKNGFFYVLDRATGELISARPYTHVTWAEGIDPESGRPIENPRARDFENPIPVFPWFGGGHNWPPMSYNPLTGLVYFAEMSVPQVNYGPKRDIDRVPGSGWTNTGFDSMAGAPPDVSTAELNAIMETATSGRLLAWDPIAQEERWQHDAGRALSAGALSTAGLLVFQGDADNAFNAYDAESGTKLWSADAQTQVQAAPISYRIDGEQYVAVAAGYGGGAAHEAGSLTHGRKLRNKSRVLVYKLGGSQVLPPLPVDDRVMPQPLPATASADVVAEGQVLYQRLCAWCHGDGLRTGGINPDLRWSSEATHDNWQKIVIDGVLETRGMVGFSRFIDDEGAESIRQYVLAEANRLYAELNARAPATE